MSRAYPYVLALGVVSAFAWIGLMYAGSARSPRQLEKDVTQQLDGFLVGLLGAGLFGRMAFVGLHWRYFSRQPFEMVKFWEGGLTPWAAGLGAILGIWTYSRLVQRSWWGLLDNLAVPATIVVFAGWMGCLLDGCAYGRQVDHSWWAPYTPDLLGLRRPRVPTQSLGAIASAGWILGLQRWGRGPWPQGTTGLLAVGGHSLVATALSALRADPVPYVVGVRSDGLGSAALALLAMGLMIARWTTEQG